MQVTAPGHEPLPALGVAAYNAHARLAMLRVEWGDNPPPPAPLAEGPPAKGSKVSMMVAGSPAEEYEVLDTADAIGFSFSHELKNDPTLGGSLLVQGGRVVGMTTGAHLSAQADGDPDPDARALGPCFDAARVELLRALRPRPTIPWSMWPTTCADIDRSEQIVKDGLKKLDKQATPQDRINVYQPAVEADPYNWNAWTELAFDYYKLKRPEDAIAAAENSILLGPTSDEAYRVRGRVLGMFGDSVGAIESARQAIRLQPRGWGSHFLIGYVHLMNHEYDKATEQLNEELHLHPDYQSAKDALQKIKERRADESKKVADPK